MFHSIARLSGTATIPTAKRFKLYTAPTPNGYQPSIMLEELKVLYGSEMEYDVEKIHLFGKDRQPQKEPWFMAMNTNGRIPVLIDRSRNSFHVFESAAILFYLAQHYDPGYYLWFNQIVTAECCNGFFLSSPPAWEHCPYAGTRWTNLSASGLLAVLMVFFQTAYHFRSAPEQIPYAIARYQGEVERLYSVLDSHLINRDWLAGTGHGKHSLADIKPFPWIRRHYRVGIETLDRCPNLQAWLARVEARPPVMAGLEVPN